MSYTSSITIGPGQDYASLALANNEVRQTIQDGEHYLYTLVPSSFDYAGVLAWDQFRSYTTDAGNNFEITVSGNTSGVDPFSYCVEPATFHRFENNNGGNKTFNIVGISFVASAPLVHRGCFRVGVGALEGDFTINITNCKADFSLGDATTGRVDFIEDRRSGDALSASLYTYNITNCQFRTDGRGIYRGQGGGCTSGSTLINVVGSTLHATNGRFLLDPHDRSDHDLECNFSGCLSYAVNSPYEVMDTNLIQSNYSGTVIDCIITEASSNTAIWAPNQRQNVTNDASFFFDPAGTAEGDNVYFSGTNTTFTHDYRLYDDPNNLAIGYVSNITLPSPDLVGNSRGTSPFDAGAFAIVADALNNAEVAFGKLFMRVH